MSTTWSNTAVYHVRRLMTNTGDKTSTNMSNRRFTKSYPHKYWLRLTVLLNRYSWGWWWRWLSTSFVTHLVSSPSSLSSSSFLRLALCECGCQREFISSIPEWGYILLSLLFASSLALALALSLSYSLSMSQSFFFTYTSPSWQRKKQKKAMNTSRLAHISISIFRLCRSRLFSVDAASYFLAGRRRLSFFACARDRVQEKHKKREGETTHFFPYVCLRLVSWIVNTQFFPSSPIVYHQNEQKTGWCRMCVRSHAHKGEERKKEEGRIHTRIEDGSSRIGIKKARGGKERLWS